MFFVSGREEGREGVDSISHSCSLGKKWLAISYDSVISDWRVCLSVFDPRNLARTFYVPVGGGRFSFALFFCRD